ncbi:MAG: 6-carboxytetrahydropterin synthase [Magnetococcales bacterium]|nr:6-carboxytetrahydropterin synthase [Magnetococcales bacterium]
MFEVSLTIDFCYGHRLLDYDGKCKHLHGHNGKARVVLQGDSLDNRGILFDFKEVKQKVKGWIDEEIDHTLLLRADDPLLPLLEGREERVRALTDNPTAETLARWIHTQVTTFGYPVVEVTVWESDCCSATYR